MLTTQNIALSLWFTFPFSAICYTLLHVRANTPTSSSFTATDHSNQFSLVYLLKIFWNHKSATSVLFERKKSFIWNSCESEMLNKLTSSYCKYVQYTTPSVHIIVKHSPVTCDYNKKNCSIYILEMKINFRPKFYLNLFFFVICEYV